MGEFTGGGVGFNYLLYLLKDLQAILVWQQRESHKYRFKKTFTRLIIYITGPEYQ